MSRATCKRKCTAGLGMGSAEAAQADELVALVGGVLQWAELAGALALHAQATGTAARCSEAAKLAVLHGGVADPVDAGVVTDALVEWVHHHNLKPLVHGILSNPVGVQDTQATA